MSDSCDCAGDAAAYLLGALEPDEAEAFRVHLESCVVYRDELAALGWVVDAVALSAPAQPVPRRLRRRVFRAVRAEPRSTARSGPSAPRWLGVPRPALAGLAALAVAGLAVGGVELSSGGAEGARVINRADL